MAGLHREMSEKEMRSGLIVFKSVYQGGKRGGQLNKQKEMGQYDESYLDETTGRDS